MKRINVYGEEVEVEVLGEVNHYEKSYMEDFQDLIKEEHEEELEQFLIRA